MAAILDIVVPSRRREKKLQLAFEQQLHSRYGDPSITAPSEGGWNQFGSGKAPLVDEYPITILQGADSPYVNDSSTETTPQDVDAAVDSDTQPEAVVISEPEQQGKNHVTITIPLPWPSKKRSASVTSRTQAKDLPTATKEEPLSPLVADNTTPIEDEGSMQDPKHTMVDMGDGIFRVQTPASLAETRESMNSSPVLIVKSPPQQHLKNFSQLGNSIMRAGSPARSPSVPDRGSTVSSRIPNRSTNTSPLLQSRSTNTSPLLPSRSPNSSPVLVFRTFSQGHAQTLADLGLAPSPALRTFTPPSSPPQGPPIERQVSPPVRLNSAGSFSSKGHMLDPVPPTPAEWIDEESGTAQYGFSSEAREFPRNTVAYEDRARSRSRARREDRGSSRSRAEGENRETSRQRRTRERSESRGPSSRGSTWDEARSVQSPAIGVDLDATALTQSSSRTQATARSRSVQSSFRVPVQDEPYLARSPPVGVDQDQPSSRQSSARGRTQDERYQNQPPPLGIGSEPDVSLRSSSRTPAPDTRRHGHVRSVSQDPIRTRKGLLRSASRGPALETSEAVGRSTSFEAPNSFQYAESVSSDDSQSRKDSASCGGPAGSNAGSGGYYSSFADEYRLIGRSVDKNNASPDLATSKGSPLMTGVKTKVKKVKEKLEEPAGISQELVPSGSQLWG